ncbi:MAG: 2,3,4,5-tetrahydropyridine-2,6-dicarboxylate N-succinyltransferase [Gammaproteobacteria bacterium]|nr:2,3,4,5-tetrahydropyridine-2,6-dicarboxylate N-succinyltransferase [Gammaproteobacteria bacterium]
MNLQSTIEQAFDNRLDYTPDNVPTVIRNAVEEVIAALDSGEQRIAQKIDGHWQVNAWLKKAVLLSFRILPNAVVDGGFTQYYDKVPLKFSHYDVREWNLAGIRAIPGTQVRRGAFVAKNTVLMPAYINIGAYVDSGTLVDTWATVGSCAQVGKNVHLSGGAGLGGILEPVQAAPTIIEDNCFIGARSEIVEGVIVEENSVISMGVYIGQSTKIYNRQTGEISYGRVPAGSVVVPGALPAADGSHSLYCAVIIKTIDAKTREKVALNELLREAGVPHA